MSNQWECFVIFLEKPCKFSYLPLHVPFKPIQGIFQWGRDSLRQTDFLTSRIASIKPFTSTYLLVGHRNPSIYDTTNDAIARTRRPVYRVPARILGGTVGVSLTKLHFKVPHSTV